MTDIADIVARQIIDSRGNPTVEVDVTLEDGSIAWRTDLYSRCQVGSGAQHPDGTYLGLVQDLAGPVSCSVTVDPETENVIAATAHVHGLTVVTRNLRHFEHSGCRLLSPWSV